MPYSVVILIIAGDIIFVPKKVKGRIENHDGHSVTVHTRLSTMSSKNYRTNTNRFLSVFLGVPSLQK